MLPGYMDFSFNFPSRFFYLLIYNLFSNITYLKACKRYDVWEYTLSYINCNLKIYCFLCVKDVTHTYTLIHTDLHLSCRQAEAYRLRSKLQQRAQSIQGQASTLLQTLITPTIPLPPRLAPPVALQPLAQLLTSIMESQV